MGSRGEKGDLEERRNRKLWSVCKVNEKKMSFK